MKYHYYITNDENGHVLTYTEQKRDDVAIHWAVIELRKLKDVHPTLSHATLWKHGSPYGIYKIKGFYRKD